ncbi:MAG: phosphohydrolase [Planctomycetaceae bacterium]|nr:phosphohydrolase [Planctomycetaceae bacterium]
MNNSDENPVLRSIEQMFERCGHSMYGREAVSQQQHALQCAALAEAAGAGPEQIAAALLHDIGHLLHSLPDDAPGQGIDDAHEQLAADWLAERLPEAVVAPVRMHVAAKRYLCAAESGYEQSLSDPSRLSLRLQGGPMNAEEQRAFEHQAFYRQAVQLRRWDDAAKDPAAATPALPHFLNSLKRCFPA